MTWDIAFVFALLILTLISFVWEKVPADVTALSVFAILIATGILSSDDAFRVFSNPAPITVGAMFMLSAALEKTGLIRSLTHKLQRLSRLTYRPFLIIIMLLVGILSGFINNTPVVVVMLPIVLSLSSKIGVAGSKVLIPLSYASILGGTCTLLGTSTNIIVSGVSEKYSGSPLGMFEFAFIGIPVFLAGLIYLTLFGNKLLPWRETLTSILSEEERREYIAEAFVDTGSPAIGKTLKEAGFKRTSGVRVIDLVRSGVSLQGRMQEIKLRDGDRLFLACRASGLAQARSIEGIDLATERELGLEHINAHEGLIVEGILGPNSEILGKTLEEVNFRQRYRLVVLAIHRNGKNLRDQLGTLRLAFGDTLLLLGTDEAIQNMSGSEDIILMENRAVPSKSEKRKSFTVLAALAGVVTCASTGFAPIEVAAIVACAVLFLTNCLRPKDGYAAVQWNILFIIFGMLSLGMAMSETGASAWLADQLISGVTLFTSEGTRPYVMLACLYLLTNILTEVLSNNAAAVLMATLAVGIAETLGVDMKPFLMTVAVAASASFSTPIGYQTNTYVYGAGGYRFSDFVKIGGPLNLICFIISIIVIPTIWMF
ncbi:SLC13 family permease [Pelagicoccus albus]|uniref:SLC13 family permease n=1 Tax=Pelagicoccus albus TaxID=415222 RepID=A0A7X1E9W6_9BACT|nr:SLC13 family permease [Pelagicoccus albus]MBC2607623.1 SLC13 family permease [Pelagicoccus albus]